MLPFPLPQRADQARLLLKFIKLGLIVVDIREFSDRIEFLVRSPERYNFKSEDEEELDGRKVAIQFKKQLQESEPKLNIVVRRSPYKNKFDDWDESDGDTAYEEYKTFMMAAFPEEELLI